MLSKDGRDLAVLKRLMPGKKYFLLFKSTDQNIGGIHIVPEESISIVTKPVNGRKCHVIGEITFDVKQFTFTQTFQCPEFNK